MIEADVVFLAEMTRVYIALGSNVGDREGNLARAIELLSQRGVRESRRASIYETEPVGMRDQTWFLNSVVQAETELMPTQLMNTLLEIEREMGRQRRERNGPRVIDLDILLYGTSTLKTKEVEIPHPRMAERRFVLAPLAEIAADARHPVSNKTIGELLDALEDPSEVRTWKG